MGIRNFKHKGLAELYIHGQTRKLGNRYVERTLFLLDILDGMVSLDACKTVRDFHELKGARKGTYSMHVNGNYCLTFKWDEQDAYDVNFEDYH